MKTELTYTREELLDILDWFETNWMVGFISNNFSERREYYRQLLIEIERP